MTLWQRQGAARCPRTGCSGVGDGGVIGILWVWPRRRGAEEASRRSRGGAGLSTQSETGRYRGGLVPGVPHES